MSAAWLAEREKKHRHGVTVKSGAPERIRTSDPQIRRQRQAIEEIQIILKLAPRDAQEDQGVGKAPVNRSTVTVTVSIAPEPTCYDDPNSEPDRSDPTPPVIAAETSEAVGSEPMLRRSRILSEAIEATLERPSVDRAKHYVMSLTGGNQALAAPFHDVETCSADIKTGSPPESAPRSVPRTKWHQILSAVAHKQAWTPHDLLPIAESLGYDVQLTLAKVQVAHFVQGGIVERVTRGLYRVAPGFAAEHLNNEEVR